MTKLLDIKNLSVSFKTKNSDIKVVKGINLHLDEGEILGIVGESGSGKSVSMKSILGLLTENAVVSSDKISFENIDISLLADEDYNFIRGSKITMIFQDPMTALNPLIKIGKQLEEVIIRHKKIDKKEAQNHALYLLEQVGISAPKQRLRQYPHELSGGMRQRVLIAMALACEPKILIADEPTTALDVTIQAQILDILKNLNEKFKMSIILITHDMGVVATLCDRVVIMYGGLIMEEGSVEEIFYNPKHPYTKALLKAIPTLDLKDGERLKSIKGAPPSLKEDIIACPFAKRCDFAFDDCTKSIPPPIKYSYTHYSSCFLNVKEGEYE